MVKATADNSRVTMNLTEGSSFLSHQSSKPAAVPPIKFHRPSNAFYKSQSHPAQDIDQSTYMLKQQKYWIKTKLHATRRQPDAYETFNRRK